jgi:hypothetical protein
MTCGEMYNDFQVIRTLNAPIQTKVGMLTYLFSNHPKQWRVVGVTVEALLRFEQFAFQRVAKMGINRSHLVDRMTTYTRMIGSPFNGCEDWWKFYYENDRTVLATSSENTSGIYSEILWIDESLDLFRSSGYSWTQNKAEREFLKNLLFNYRRQNERTSEIIKV